MSDSDPHTLLHNSEEYLSLEPVQATRSPEIVSIVEDARGRFSLPRELQRPVTATINTAYLERYPDLKGVPVEYVRENLPIAEMRAALQGVKVVGRITRTLTLSINTGIPPTHMLATETLSSSSDRQFTLFPVHDLVLAMYCADLPTLPQWIDLPEVDISSLELAVPAASATPISHRTVAVIPVRIPSPQTFPLLLSYFYADIAHLRSELQPPTDVAQLLGHAIKIFGLWKNACAFLVADDRLYEIIELAWEETITEIQTHWS
ncbi:hypothetical protein B0H11DRAFT_1827737 [Mycena galericulata]|nr:hypothetical protein B0H11DRAFT_1827737 [Mycena galericulata]